MQLQQQSTMKFVIVALLFGNLSHATIGGCTFNHDCTRDWLGWDCTCRKMAEGFKKAMWDQHQINCWVNVNGLGVGCENKCRTCDLAGAYDCYNHYWDGIC